MNGIIVVIACIVIVCTVVNYKRGIQPRFLLTLSLILIATLIVGLLGPVMRQHPVASMLVSLGASYALYFFFKARAKRISRMD